MESSRKNDRDVSYLSVNNRSLTISAPKRRTQGSHETSTYNNNEKFKPATFRQEKSGHLTESVPGKRSTSHTSVPESNSPSADTQGRAESVPRHESSNLPVDLSDYLHDTSVWEAMEIRFLDKGKCTVLRPNLSSVISSADASATSQSSLKSVNPTAASLVGPGVQLLNTPLPIRRQKVCVEKVHVRNLLNTKREKCGNLSSSRLSEYTPHVVDMARNKCDDEEMDTTDQGSSKSGSSCDTDSESFESALESNVFVVHSGVEKKCANVSRVDPDSMLRDTVQQGLDGDDVCGDDDDDGDDVDERTNDDEVSTFKDEKSRNKTDSSRNDSCEITCLEKTREICTLGHGLTPTDVRAATDHKNLSFYEPKRYASQNSSLACHPPVWPSPQCATPSPRVTTQFNDSVGLRSTRKSFSRSMTSRDSTSGSKCEPAGADYDPNAKLNGQTHRALGRQETSNESLKVKRCPSDARSTSAKVYTLSDNTSDVVTGNISTEAWIKYCTGFISRDKGEARACLKTSETKRSLRGETKHRGQGRETADVCDQAASSVFCQMKSYANHMTSAPVHTASVVDNYSALSSPSTVDKNSFAAVLKLSAKDDRSASLVGAKSSVSTFSPLSEAEIAKYKEIALEILMQRKKTQAHKAETKSSHENSLGAAIKKKRDGSVKKIIKSEKILPKSTDKKAADNKPLKVRSSSTGRLPRANSVNDRTIFWASQRIRNQIEKHKQRLSQPKKTKKQKNSSKTKSGGAKPLSVTSSNQTTIEHRELTSMNERKSLQRSVISETSFTVSSIPVSTKQPGRKKSFLSIEEEEKHELSREPSSMAFRSNATSTTKLEWTPVKGSEASSQVFPEAKCSTVDKCEQVRLFDPERESWHRLCSVPTLVRETQTDTSKTNLKAECRSVGIGPIQPSLEKAEFKEKLASCARESSNSIIKSTLTNKLCNGQQGSSGSCTPQSPSQCPQDDIAASSETSKHLTAQPTRYLDLLHNILTSPTSKTTQALSLFLQKPKALAEAERDLDITVDQIINSYQEIFEELRSAPKPSRSRDSQMSTEQSQPVFSSKNRQFTAAATYECSILEADKCIFPVFTCSSCSSGSSSTPSFSNDDNATSECRTLRPVEHSREGKQAGVAKPDNVPDPAKRMSLKSSTLAMAFDSEAHDSTKPPTPKQAATPSKHHPSSTPRVSRSRHQQQPTSNVSKSKLFVFDSANDFVFKPEEKSASNWNQAGRNRLQSQPRAQQPLKKNSFKPDASRKPMKVSSQHAHKTGPFEQPFPEMLQKNSSVPRQSLNSAKKKQISVTTKENIRPLGSRSIACSRVASNEVGAKLQRDLLTWTQEKENNQFELLLQNFQQSLMFNEPEPLTMHQTRPAITIIAPQACLNISSSMMPDIQSGGSSLEFEKTCHQKQSFTDTHLQQQGVDKRLSMDSFLQPKPQTGAQVVCKTRRIRTFPLGKRELKKGAQPSLPPKNEDTSIQQNDIDKRDSETALHHKERQNSEEIAVSGRNHPNRTIPRFVRPSTEKVRNLRQQPATRTNSEHVTLRTNSNTAMPPSLELKTAVPPIKITRPLKKKDFLRKSSSVDSALSSLHMFLKNSQEHHESLSLRANNIQDNVQPPIKDQEEKTEELIVASSASSTVHPEKEQDASDKKQSPVTTEKLGLSIRHTSAKVPPRRIILRRNETGKRTGSPPSQIKQTSLKSKSIIKPIKTTPMSCQPQPVTTATKSLSASRLDEFGKPLQMSTVKRTVKNQQFGARRKGQQSSQSFRSTSCPLGQRGKYDKPWLIRRYYNKEHSTAPIKKLHIFQKGSEPTAKGGDVFNFNIKNEELKIEKDSDNALPLETEFGMVDSKEMSTELPTLATETIPGNHPNMISQLDQNMITKTTIDAQTSAERPDDGVKETDLRSFEFITASVLHAPSDTAQQISSNSNLQNLPASLNSANKLPVNLKTDNKYSVYNMENAITGRSVMTANDKWLGHPATARLQTFSEEDSESEVLSLQAMRRHAVARTCEMLIRESKTTCDKNRTELSNDLLSANRFSPIQKSMDTYLGYKATGKMWPTDLLARTGWLMSSLRTDQEHNAITKSTLSQDTLDSLAPINAETGEEDEESAEFLKSMSSFKVSNRSQAVRDLLQGSGLTRHTYDSESTIDECRSGLPKMIAENYRDMHPLASSTRTDAIDERLALRQHLDGQLTDDKCPVVMSSTEQMMRNLNIEEDFVDPHDRIVLGKPFLNSDESDISKTEKLSGETAPIPKYPETIYQFDADEEGADMSSNISDKSAYHGEIVVEHEHIYPNTGEIVTDLTVTDNNFAAQASVLENNESVLTLGEPTRINPDADSVIGEKNKEINYEKLIRNLEREKHHVDNITEKSATFINVSDTNLHNDIIEIKSVLYQNKSETGLDFYQEKNEACPKRYLEKCQSDQNLYQDKIETKHCLYKCLSETKINVDRDSSGIKINAYQETMPKVNKDISQGVFIAHEHISQTSLNVYKESSPVDIVVYQENSKTILNTYQDNSQTIRNFYQDTGQTNPNVHQEQSQTIQNTHQEHSQTIQNTHQEHSQTIQNFHQEHSQTIQNFHQEHSQTIQNFHQEHSQTIQNFRQEHSQTIHNFHQEHISAVQNVFQDKIQTVQNVSQDSSHSTLNDFQDNSQTVQNVYQGISQTVQNVYQGISQTKVNVNEDIIQTSPIVCYDISQSKLAANKTDQRYEQLEKIITSPNPSTSQTESLHSKETSLDDVSEQCNACCTKQSMATITSDFVREEIGHVHSTDNVYVKGDRRECLSPAQMSAVMPLSDLSVENVSISFRDYSRASVCRHGYIDGINGNIFEKPSTRANNKDDLQYCSLTNAGMECVTPPTTLSLYPAERPSLSSVITHSDVNISKDDLVLQDASKVISEGNSEAKCGVTVDKPNDLGDMQHRDIRTTEELNIQGEELGNKTISLEHQKLVHQSKINAVSHHVSRDTGQVPHTVCESDDIREGADKFGKRPAPAKAEFHRLSELNLASDLDLPRRLVPEDGPSCFHSVGRCPHCLLSCTRRCCHERCTEGVHFDVNARQSSENRSQSGGEIVKCCANRDVPTAAASTCAAPQEVKMRIRIELNGDNPCHCRTANELGCCRCPGTPVSTEVNNEEIKELTVHLGSHRHHKHAACWHRDPTVCGKHRGHRLTECWSDEERVRCERFNVFDRRDVFSPTLETDSEQPARWRAGNFEKSRRGRIPTPVSPSSDEKFRNADFFTEMDTTPRAASYTDKCTDIGEGVSFKVDPFRDSFMSLDPRLKPSDMAATDNPLSIYTDDASSFHGSVDTSPEQFFLATSPGRCRRRYSPKANTYASTESGDILTLTSKHNTRKSPVSVSSDVISNKTVPMTDADEVSSVIRKNDLPSPAVTIKSKRASPFETIKEESQTQVYSVNNDPHKADTRKGQETAKKQFISKAAKEKLRHLEILRADLETLCETVLSCDDTARTDDNAEKASSVGQLPWRSDRLRNIMMNKPEQQNVNTTSEQIPEKNGDIKNNSVNVRKLSRERKINDILIQRKAAENLEMFLESIRQMKKYSQLCSPPFKPNSWSSSTSRSRKHSSMPEAQERQSFSAHFNMVDLPRSFSASSRICSNFSLVSLPEMYDTLLTNRTHLSRQKFHISPSRKYSMSRESPYRTCQSLEDRFVLVPSPVRSTPPHPPLTTPAPPLTIPAAPHRHKEYVKNLVFHSSTRLPPNTLCQPTEEDDYSSDSENTETSLSLLYKVSAHQQLVNRLHLQETHQNSDACSVGKNKSRAFDIFSLSPSSKQCRQEQESHTSAGSCCMARHTSGTKHSTGIRYLKQEKRAAPCNPFLVDILSNPFIETNSAGACLSGVKNCQERGPYLSSSKYSFEFWPRKGNPVCSHSTVYFPLTDLNLGDPKLTHDVTDQMNAPREDFMFTADELISFFGRDETNSIPDGNSHCSVGKKLSGIFSNMHPNECFKCPTEIIDNKDWFHTDTDSKDWFHTDTDNKDWFHTDIDNKDWFHNGIDNKDWFHTDIDNKDWFQWPSDIDNKDWFQCSTEINNKDWFQWSTERKNNKDWLQFSTERTGKKGENHLNPKTSIPPLLDHDSEAVLNGENYQQEFQDANTWGDSETQEQKTGQKEGNRSCHVPDNYLEIFNPKTAERKGLNPPNNTFNVKESSPKRRNVGDRVTENCNKGVIYDSPSFCACSEKPLLPHQDRPSSSPSVTIARSSDDDCKSSIQVDERGGNLEYIHSFAELTSHLLTAYLRVRDKLKRKCINKKKRRNPKRLENHRRLSTNACSGMFTLTQARHSKKSGVAASSRKTDLRKQYSCRHNVNYPLHTYSHLTDDSDTSSKTTTYISTRGSCASTTWERFEKSNTSDASVMSLTFLESSRCPRGTPGKYIPPADTSRRRRTPESSEFSYATVSSPPKRGESPGELSDTKRVDSYIIMEERGCDNERACPVKDPQCQDDNKNSQTVSFITEDRCPVEKYFSSRKSADGLVEVEEVELPSPATVGCNDGALAKQISDGQDHADLNSHEAEPAIDQQPTVYFCGSPPNQWITPLPYWQTLLLLLSAPEVFPFCPTPDCVDIKETGLDSMESDLDRKDSDLLTLAENDLVERIPKITTKGFRALQRESICEKLLLQAAHDAHAQREFSGNASPSESVCGTQDVVYQTKIFEQDYDGEIHEVVFLTKDLVVGDGTEQEFQAPNIWCKDGGCWCLTGKDTLRRSNVIDDHPPLCYQSVEKEEKEEKQRPSPKRRKLNRTSSKMDKIASPFSKRICESSDRDKVKYDSCETGATYFKTCREHTGGRKKSVKHFTHKPLNFNRILYNDGKFTPQWHSCSPERLCRASTDRLNAMDERECLKEEKQDVASVFNRTYSCRGQDEWLQGNNPPMDSSPLSEMQTEFNEDDGSNELVGRKTRTESPYFFDDYELDTYEELGSLFTEMQESSTTLLMQDDMVVRTDDLSLSDCDDSVTSQSTSSISSKTSHLSFESPVEKKDVESYSAACAATQTLLTVHQYLSELTESTETKSKMVLGKEALLNESDDAVATESTSSGREKILNEAKSVQVSLIAETKAAMEILNLAPLLTSCFTQTDWMKSDAALEHSIANSESSKCSRFKSILQKCIRSNSFLLYVQKIVDERLARKLNDNRCGEVDIEKLPDSGEATLKKLRRSSSLTSSTPQGDNYDDVMFDANLVGDAVNKDGFLKEENAHETRERGTPRKLHLGSVNKDSSNCILTMPSSYDSMAMNTSEGHKIENNADCRCKLLPRHKVLSLRRLRRNKDTFVTNKVLSDSEGHPISSSSLIIMWGDSTEQPTLQDERPGIVSSTISSVSCHSSSLLERSSRSQLISTSSNKSGRMREAHLCDKACSALNTAKSQESEFPASSANSPTRYKKRSVRKEGLKSCSSEPYMKPNSEEDSVPKRRASPHADIKNSESAGTVTTTSVDYGRLKNIMSAETKMLWKSLSRLEKNSEKCPACRRQYNSLLSNSSHRLEFMKMEANSDHHRYHRNDLSTVTEARDSEMNSDDLCRECYSMQHLQGVISGHMLLPREDALSPNIDDRQANFEGNTTKTGTIAKVVRDGTDSVSCDASGPDEGVCHLHLARMAKLIQCCPDGTQEVLMKMTKDCGHLNSAEDHISTDSLFESRNRKMSEIEEETNANLILMKDSVYLGSSEYMFGFQDNMVGRKRFNNTEMEAIDIKFNPSDTDITRNDQHSLQSVASKSNKEQNYSQPLNESASTTDQRIVRYPSSDIDNNQYIGQSVDTLRFSKASMPGINKGQQFPQPTESDRPEESRKRSSEDSASHTTSDTADYWIERLMNILHEMHQTFPNANLLRNASELPERIAPSEGEMASPVGELEAKAKESNFEKISEDNPTKYSEDVQYDKVGMTLGENHQILNEEKREKEGISTEISQRVYSEVTKAGTHMDRDSSVTQCTVLTNVEEVVDFNYPKKSGGQGNSVELSTSYILSKAVGMHDSTLQDTNGDVYQNEWTQHESSKQCGSLTECHSYRNQSDPESACHMTEVFSPKVNAKDDDVETDPSLRALFAMSEPLDARRPPSSTSLFSDCPVWDHVKFSTSHESQKHAEPDQSGRQDKTLLKQATRHKKVLFANSTFSYRRCPARKSKSSPELGQITHLNTSFNAPIQLEETVGGRKQAWRDVSKPSYRLRRTESAVCQECVTHAQLSSPAGHSKDLMKSLSEHIKQLRDSAQEVSQNVKILADGRIYETGQKTQTGGHNEIILSPNDKENPKETLISSHADNSHRKSEVSAQRSPVVRGDALPEHLRTRRQVAEEPVNVQKEKDLYRNDQAERGSIVRDEDITKVNDVEQERKDVRYQGGARCEFSCIPAHNEKSEQELNESLNKSFTDEINRAGAHQPQVTNKVLTVTKHGANGIKMHREVEGGHFKEGAAEKSEGEKYEDTEVTSSKRKKGKSVQCEHRPEATAPCQGNEEYNMAESKQIGPAYSHSERLKETERGVDEMVAVNDMSDQRYGNLSSWGSRMRLRRRPQNDTQSEVSGDTVAAIKNLSHAIDDKSDQFAYKFINRDLNHSLDDDRKDPNHRAERGESDRSLCEEKNDSNQRCVGHMEDLSQRVDSGVQSDANQSKSADSDHDVKPNISAGSGHKPKQLLACAANIADSRQPVKDEPNRGTVKHGVKVAWRQPVCNESKEFSREAVVGGRGKEKNRTEQSDTDGGALGHHRQIYPDNGLRLNSFIQRDRVSTLTDKYERTDSALSSDGETSPSRRLTLAIDDRFGSNIFIRNDQKVKGKIFQQNDDKLRESRRGQPAGGRLKLSSDTVEGLSINAVNSVGKVSEGDSMGRSPAITQRGRQIAQSTDDSDRPLNLSDAPGQNLSKSPALPVMLSETHPSPCRQTPKPAADTCQSTREHAKGFRYTNTTVTTNGYSMVSEDNIGKLTRETLIKSSTIRSIASSKDDFATEQISLKIGEPSVYEDESNTMIDSLCAKYKLHESLTLAREYASPRGYTASKCLSPRPQTAREVSREKDSPSVSSDQSSAYDVSEECCYPADFTSDRCEDPFWGDIPAHSNDKRPTSHRETSVKSETFDMEETGINLGAAGSGFQSMEIPVDIYTVPLKKSLKASSSQKKRKKKKEPAVTRTVVISGPLSNCTIPVHRHEKSETEDDLSFQNPSGALNAVAPKVTSLKRKPLLNKEFPRGLMSSLKSFLPFRKKNSDKPNQMLTK